MIMKALIVLGGKWFSNLLEKCFDCTIQFPDLVFCLWRLYLKLLHIKFNYNDIYALILFTWLILFFCEI